MAVYQILGEKDPVLRQKSKAIPNVTPNVVKLLDNLNDTLRDNGNGVGLAAPQIGILKRALVIIIPPEEDAETEEDKAVVSESPKPSENPNINADMEEIYEIINPVILEREGLIRDTEGCLSLPDLTGEVDRFEKVRVGGLNRKGEPVEYSAEGFLARVFQHEIDHLDGILFVDRAVSVKPLEKSNE